MFKMNNLWTNFIFVLSYLILCRGDLQEHENIQQSGSTFELQGVNLKFMLDTNNQTTGWTIGSAPSKGYLYYFENPLDINKTLLDLGNPDDVDLSKFQGVDGVWVFPHKRFTSPPVETLYAVFNFSGFAQLYESVGINYYAYKGGEINVFVANKTIATFREENGTTGWSYQSVNLPTPLTNFRVEVRAEVEGSFVFIDKIIAGGRIVNETEVSTTMSSEETVSPSSTSSTPTNDTEITEATTTSFDVSHTTPVETTILYSSSSSTKYPDETTESVATMPSMPKYSLVMIIFITCQVIRI